jgi:ribonuclease HI
MNTAVLFTDGAARGNPGPGGWGFVLVVNDQVTEGSGAKNPTTNNAMELSAVIAGIKKFLVVGETKKLTIHLDSKYVRDGSISWRHGWARNGWMTKEKQSISNKDLWQELHKILNQCAELGITIDWDLVRGHRGIPGNERCDYLATTVADTGVDQSYNGPLSGHPFAKNLLTVPKTTEPYYIAFADGQLQKFTKWDDCSQWVRGRKAKYKKVHSTLEEESVLEGWGVSRER